MADEDQIDLQLRVRELEAQVSELRTVCIRAQKDLMDEVIPREDIVVYLRAVARENGEHWTPQDVIDAMKLWNSKYGRPPSSANWAPALLRDRGRDDDLTRFLDGRWPHPTTVRRHFGSFTAALAAAGFPPSPAGRPAGLDRDRMNPLLPDWTGWAMIPKLRLRGGMSVAELSRRTHISYNHLRQLESGDQQNPAVRMLLALGKGLEVSPASLLEGTEGLRAAVLDAVDWGFRQPAAELLEEAAEGTTEEDARVNAIRWRIAQVAWDRSSEEGRP